MRLTYRVIVALGALTLAAAASIAAQAGPAAGGWARISGPTAPGQQLGLARTPDGTLHVIWNRGATPTSIFETRLSPAGKPVGTSTVAGGWDGNGGLALLVMPDKTLRLFAAGATHPGSSAYGVNTFTAPMSGGKWSLQAGAFWGGAVANSAAYLGATLTSQGQPVTAWRGFAAEGLAPNVPANPYQADMVVSQLATDAGNGAVVLSGVTIAGKGGVFVRQVLPSLGARVVLPLPFAQQNWSSGLSARLGAPGAYVAYADTKAVRLYRYGGGSKTLARGPFSSATVCPGPGGRLWVAWGDKTDGLFVTRSSRAVGAFEPVQRLKLPQNTSDGLSNVQCEGSSGPLDLFADVLVGTAGGFWQTHVLAQFSLSAQVARTKTGAKVTLLARDAGDPLAGAAITVAGKHLHTDARGRATLTLRAGTYAATATAPGYRPASLRLSLR